jgi:hypothetical protein
MPGRKGIKKQEEDAEEQRQRGVTNLRVYTERRAKTKRLEKMLAYRDQLPPPLEREHTITRERTPIGLQKGPIKHTPRHRQSIKKKSLKQRERRLAKARLKPEEYEEWKKQSKSEGQRKRHKKDELPFTFGEAPTGGAVDHAVTVSELPPLPESTPSEVEGSTGATTLLGGVDINADMSVVGEDEETKEEPPVPVNAWQNPAGPAHGAVLNAIERANRPPETQVSLNDAGQDGQLAEQQHDATLTSATLAQHTRETAQPARFFEPAEDWMVVDPYVPREAVEEVFDEVEQIESRVAELREKLRSQTHNAEGLNVERQLQGPEKSALVKTKRELQNAEAELERYTELRQQRIKEAFPEEFFNGDVDLELFQASTLADMEIEDKDVEQRVKVLKDQLKVLNNHRLEILREIGPLSKSTKRDDFRRAQQKLVQFEKIVKEIHGKEDNLRALQPELASKLQWRRDYLQHRMKEEMERSTELEKQIMLQEYKAGEPYYRIKTGKKELSQVQAVHGEFKDKEGRKVIKPLKGWEAIMNKFMVLEEKAKVPVNERDEKWIREVTKLNDDLNHLWNTHTKKEDDLSMILADLEGRRAALAPIFERKMPKITHGRRKPTYHPIHQQYMDNIKKQKQDVIQNLRRQQIEAQAPAYPREIAEANWTSLKQSLHQEMTELLLQAKQDVSANAPVISTIIQKIMDWFEAIPANAPARAYFEKEIQAERDKQIDEMSKYGFHEQGRQLFKAAHQEKLVDFIMNPLSFHDASKQQEILHSKLGLAALQARRLLTLTSNMLRLRQIYLMPVYAQLNAEQSVEGGKFDLATTHLFPPDMVEMRLRVLKLQPENVRGKFGNSPFLQAIKQFEQFKDFDLNNLTEDTFGSTVAGINKAVGDFLKDKVTSAGVSWTDFMNGMTQITREVAYVMSQVNPRLPADKQGEPQPSQPPDQAPVDPDAGANVMKGGSTINPTFNPATQGQITRDKIDDAKRQTYRKLEEGYVLDLIRPTDDQPYVPLHVDAAQFYFQKNDFKALKDQYISLQPLIPKQPMKNADSFITSTLATYGQVLRIPQRYSKITDHPSLIQKEAIELQTLLNAYGTYTSTTLPAYTQDESSTQQDAPQNTEPQGTGPSPDTSLSTPAGAQINPLDNGSIYSDPMVSGRGGAVSMVNTLGGFRPGNMSTTPSRTSFDYSGLGGPPNEIVQGGDGWFDGGF